MIVNMRLNPDGHVCIHWFIIDPAGPITTPAGVVPSNMGPKTCGGVRGRIACNPAQNVVTPQIRGGETLVMCRTGDAQAVTCPKCMATAEFKAAVVVLEKAG